MATKAQLEQMIRDLTSKTAPAGSAPTAGWVAEAKAAAPTANPAKPKYGEVGYVPKPLVAEKTTINPDPTRGQSFTPFLVLHVHNGSNGRFYKGNRLDQRALNAVRAYTDAHGWTL